MTEALMVGAGMVLLAAVVLFVFASLIKDQSIMDWAYGLVFIFLGWGLAYYFRAWGIPLQLMLWAVSIWGVRYAVRNFLKKYGKSEDPRYAHLRDTWMKKGKFNFYIKSLVDIFLLQGLVAFIVALPIVLLAGMNPAVVPPVAYIGLFIWACGFLYQSTADFQLDRFEKNTMNKGKVMNRGLFRFSRRPDYFGECLQWWGLALFAAPMLPWPYMFIVFAGPFLTTYITTSVTGPMLERRWDNNPAYQEYRERTNYFIPSGRKSA